MYLMNYTECQRCSKILQDYEIKFCKKCLIQNKELIINENKIPQKNPSIDYYNGFPFKFSD